MKAGLCLLLVCAAVFIPWAYSQKHYAYEKADEKLARRKQKILSDNWWRTKEVANYLDGLILEWYPLVTFNDLIEGYDGKGGYYVEEDGKTYHYEISSRGSELIGSLVEDEGGTTTTDGFEFEYDGEDEFGPDIETIDDGEPFYITSIPEDSDPYSSSDLHYTDEDEDVFSVENMDLNGYIFQDELCATQDGSTLYTDAAPLPLNDMSRENETLVKAINELDIHANTQGGYKGYRYSTFFVQGMAYIKYDLSDGDNTHVTILDLRDLDKAKEQINSANGYLKYSIVHVVIFEDMEPFLQAWRMDMLKYGIALLLLWGVFVLSLFLYEKNTEKMLRLQKEMEEAMPEEDEPAVPIVEIPYEKSVSEETARVLIANIGLAEQSMGPNQFLDNLREEIEARSGKKQAAEEEAEENEE